MKRREGKGREEEEERRSAEEEEKVEGKEKRGCLERSPRHTSI